MLAKFETKSSRVKGISFHPTRPWILCSLHDGQIQLWDYRTQTLLETFTEHDGPVRSVDFHPSQPLFVSGGDDYKIRVWNYNNKRSLFTLMGHLDYIRTVQFHPENPWIVSCSDDQNIRIWNWQSRECIAILTGHNHYVMSAQFHPKEDLIVSASLDQTIRVWDISGLKKKGQKSPTPNSGPSGMIGRLSADLVGTVKYVLEGHERGVNWASFHPELPLIVSGSDDRMIKIWRTNDTKAWEVDTLRGHTNNVSCVMFHPREDLILSNSEDHSIRVWDSTKRIGLESFVRAHDRFWIITAHKTQNLIAAGHDSGAVVFKLRRERPPYAVYKNYCFYIKDRYYRIREIEGSKRDIVMMPITRGPGATNNAPRSLQYNEYCMNEFMLLMHNEEDGGMYELVTCSQQLDSKRISPTIKGGVALSVCFVSRNKFVTLESRDSLFIRNVDNIVTKRITLPLPNCVHVYPGGCSGRILLQTPTQLCLFDISSLQILYSVAADNIKRVCWNKDNSMVAMYSSNSIRILTKELKQCCLITEKMRIKSCIWDDEGVLLYCTMSQIKYCLTSGECGVVRSLDEPVYCISYQNGVMTAFTRDCCIIQIEIDSSEYLFKNCLEKKQYRKAIRIIRSSKIDSQAIVSYLQNNGFEDIALYFVKEPRARFNLAIRCGNLDIAMECATELNQNEIWCQLAEEALRQGNREIVETCYQRTKSFDKLSFLYVITGDQVKLQKMLKIAELREDIMSRYYNAMYLNDIEARINVLLDAKQYALAYITAIVYGYDDIAEKIKGKLEEENMPVPEVTKPDEVLSIPEVVNSENDWPLLEMPRSTFDRVMEEEARGENEEEEKTMVDEVNNEFNSMSSDSEEGDWLKDEEDLNLDDDDDDMKGEGNGWDDDLDFGDDDDIPMTSTVEFDAAPQPDADLSSHWCNASSLAFDHAASGNIDSTVQLLNRQLGIIRFSTMQTILKSCYCSVQSVSMGYPSMPSLQTPLVRQSSKQALPATVYSIQHASQLVKMGLKCFQSGRFEDTMNAFRSFFVILPVIVVNNKEEEMALKQFVDMGREYIIAVMIELVRHQVKDMQQSLFLSYIVTQCKLQSNHLLLTLNSAMVAAFKAENYIDAAMFAKRILVNADIKSPKNASLEMKAKKVLAKSEREGRNAIATEYDENKPFTLDCEKLTPIYRGEDIIKCPLCSATYRVDSKNKVCTVCGLAQIGLETVGLVCLDAKN